MAKPNLALIPAAQGSKLFSVLPSSGVGDFNFSRSGTATRINSQGLIEEVANVQSRLNYPMIDGKVVGCPHHILEPARTNLIQYSEDFTKSVWNNFSSITPIENSAISPDGTQNASTLECNYNAVFRYSFTASSSTNYVGSIFVKAKENNNYFGIQTLESGNAYTSVFDIQSGVLVTQASNHTSSIKDFGNGWFRCSVKFNSGSSTSNIFDFRGSQTSDTKEFYAFGAQIEQGSYPTSYIPTNGTTVTRQAETANSSGDAATFNDSEGVLMAEISALNDSQSSAGITISDSSLSNRVFMGFESGEIRALCINALSTTIIDTSGVILENYNKVACAYEGNTFKLLVNGFQVGDTESFTGSLSGINELAFDRGDGANPFYGNTKQLQYFQTALTESELSQLTSWTSFTDMAEGQLYTIE